MAKSALKYLDCIFCKRTVEASADAKAILCDHCVQTHGDPPKQPAPYVVLAPEEKAARKQAKKEKKEAKLQKMKKAKSGRGRGWHLKKLFEWDGQFYSMGKPIDDAQVAKIRKKLKNA